MRHRCSQKRHSEYNRHSIMPSTMIWICQPQSAWLVSWLVTTKLCQPNAIISCWTLIACLVYVLIRSSQRHQKCSVMRRAIWYADATRHELHDAGKNRTSSAISSKLWASRYAIHQMGQNWCDILAFYTLATHIEIPACSIAGRYFNMTYK